jgi:SpoIID/LytB domain protein
MRNQSRGDRALQARRRRSARTAALFQENDLPEFYRWTRVLTPQQMAVVLRVPQAQVSEIRVLERAPSGRIMRLQVVGRDVSDAVLTATYEKDSQIRSMFSGRLGSTTALPSSTFVIIPRRENGQVVAWVFKGAGWGHGVGMCQRGAQNRAKAGWNARQIVQWYFRGVQVTKIES